MCRLPAEQRPGEIAWHGHVGGEHGGEEGAPEVLARVFDVCACFLEGHRHRRNAQLVPDLVREALQGHPAFCGGVKRSAAGTFSSASRQKARRIEPVDCGPAVNAVADPAGTRQSRYVRL
jgi:hypothetical protein